MLNELKKMVSENKPALGTFFTLGGTHGAECLGIAGLDFIIADCEHGTMDVESVLPALLAAKAYGMTALVRPREISRTAILKLLDIGAQGLIVPCVQGLDDARRLVEYAKYAPLGARGYGIVRANEFGFADYAKNLPDYFALSNRETLLLPQCETAGCLQEIEDIAALTGVDGIFVGPYDLSIALGVPGQLDSPVMREAISRVLYACKASGKLAFIFTGSIAAAKNFFAMGFHAVACGVDTMLLTNAARDMAEKIRNT